MKIITANPARCLSCHSCELACQVSHSPAGELISAMLLGQRSKRRIYVESAGGKAVPISCRHCEKAPCMTVCPTGAIKRDHRTQAVLIEEELCIGCRSCILVCPFGVICLVKDKGIAVKCDLCKGKEPPSCVSACPTGALSLSQPDELAKIHRAKTALETWKSFCRT